ncbi:MAG: NAD(P)H-dependent oxidoreductase subunit E, partial [Gemmataceae bacterium]
VQRLREIQSRFGYLPDAQLKRLSADTGVPLYRIQEVASFFDSFRQEWDKPARVEIKVCRDYTCHHAGAPAVKAKLAGLARAGEVVVEGVSCLGRCDRAPVICINRNPVPNENPPPDDGEAHFPEPGHVHADGSFHDFIYAKKSPAEFQRIAQTIVKNEAPVPAETDARYQPHTNKPDWQIDPYSETRVFGDRTYRAVKNYLKEFPKPILPPERPNPLLRGDAKTQADKEYALELVRRHPFLHRLDPSGLLGMGGAGVPAFRKWFDVWTASGDEKYIVCNGDESEPGTFKDREIFLRMPHLVVEGVILAGLMTNATAGYIYIRHEYGEQINAVRAEIERAIELQACGDGIFGTERSFPVEVFVSPGGYICGEQSALLEAMEDRRAQPRNRPPELATNGLRDRPTVVNNV